MKRKETKKKLCNGYCGCMDCHVLADKYGNIPTPKPMKNEILHDKKFCEHKTFYGMRNGHCIKCNKAYGNCDICFPKKPMKRIKKEVEQKLACKSCRCHSEAKRCYFCAYCPKKPSPKSMKVPIREDNWKLNHYKLITRPKRQKKEWNYFKALTNSLVGKYEI